MKLPRRYFLHLAAGAAVLPAISRMSWAQAYPARPVFAWLLTRQRISFLDLSAARAPVIARSIALVFSFHMARSSELTWALSCWAVRQLRWSSTARRKACPPSCIEIVWLF
jgi:hypothetical protein